MKTLSFVVISILFCSAVTAQSTAVAEPAYIRIPQVPPFKVALAADSVLFTKDDLPNKKPVLIMVFSPDCDHCIHSTEDLVTNIKLFKKATIVLASNLSYVSVQKFYNDQKLAAYPNIKVGFDAASFLSNFYEVRSYPTIFLYDKKGTFKAVFKDHPNFKEIAKEL